MAWRRVLRARRAFRQPSTPARNPGSTCGKFATRPEKWPEIPARGNCFTFVSSRKDGRSRRLYAGARTHGRGRLKGTDMRKNQYLSNLLATTIICGAAGIATPAFAQDDTQPQSGPVEATQPADDQDDPDIVVTGSRIPHAEPHRGEPGHGRQQPGNPAAGHDPHRGSDQLAAAGLRRPGRQPRQRRHAAPPRSTFAASARTGPSC